MIKKSLIFILIVISIPFLTVQCPMQGMTALDDLNRASGNGHGGHPGAEAEPTEEDSGNNLSAPVIWTETALTVPGSFGAEVFDDTTAIYLDTLGITVYPQQAGNKWQAESVVATGAETFVDLIDWGDNLEAKNWPFGSKIRVETSLFKQLDSPMTGYKMYYVGGEGPDEVWGTNPESKGDSYKLDDNSEIYYALVYSHCAKLVIQKILVDVDEEPVVFSWNPDQESWVDEIDETNPVITNTTIAAPLFSNGVWEGEPGPDYYSAEINVGGKVIYGYNWDTRKTGDGVGHYRITFMLSDTASDARRAAFGDSTEIYAPVEEESVISTQSDEGDSGEPDLGGGTPVIEQGFNLTYIDVELTEKSSGRGKHN